MALAASSGGSDSLRASLRILPEAVVLVVMCLVCPDVERSVVVADDRTLGVDVSAVDFWTRCYTFPNVDLAIVPHRALTAPCEVLTICMGESCGVSAALGDAAVHGRAIVRVPVVSSGDCSGIAFWWQQRLGQECVSSAPGCSVSTAQAVAMLDVSVPLLVGEYAEIGVVVAGSTVLATCQATETGYESSGRPCD